MIKGISCPPTFHLLLCSPGMKMRSLESVSRGRNANIFDWNFDCYCYCYITSVVSDSVRPHSRQPTRLPRPWDSPGKNTGVGCHFLLQCMKVKSESEVAQLCPTLSDPTDRSPPGSSAHGIFQARVLEQGAIAFRMLKRKNCCFPVPASNIVKLCKNTK